MKRIAIRARCLMAALMLLTGLLGQVGHAWMHDGIADARAHAAALEAESQWLRDSGAGGADAGLLVFAGAHHHDERGGSPAHDGLDGHAADHAHAVAFLSPEESVMAGPPLGASNDPQPARRLVARGQAGQDRPPRAA